MKIQTILFYIPAPEYSLFSSWLGKAAAGLKLNLKWSLWNKAAKPV
jgi:hypothetical protein